MLQVLNGQVRSGNTLLLECLQEQEVRVGTLGHGNGLTLQIRNLSDARILAGHQSRPLRLRVEANDLDGGAISACQQRRRTGGRANINIAATQRLIRLVRAGRLDPLNLLTLGGEGGLKPTLLADNQGQRVVGRVVNGHGVLVATTGSAGGVSGTGTFTGAGAEQSSKSGSCGKGLEGGTTRRGVSHDEIFSLLKMMM